MFAKRMNVMLSRPLLGRLEEMDLLLQRCDSYQWSARRNKQVDEQMSSAKARQCSLSAEHGQPAAALQQGCNHQKNHCCPDKGHRNLLIRQRRDLYRPHMRHLQVAELVSSHKGLELIVRAGKNIAGTWHCRGTRQECFLAGHEWQRPVRDSICVDLKAVAIVPGKKLASLTSRCSMFIFPALSHRLRLVASPGLIVTAAAAVELRNPERTWRCTRARQA